MTRAKKGAAKPGSKAPRAKASRCRCGSKIHTFGDYPETLCSACRVFVDEAATRVLASLLSVADVGPKPERIRALVGVAGTYARALCDEVRGVADAADALPPATGPLSPAEGGEVDEDEDAEGDDAEAGE